MKYHQVEFFTADGIRYFKKIACHIDITTYCTLIDFSTDSQISESNIFRSYDEMQTIQLINNLIVLTFISGQKIVITPNIKKNDNGAFFR